jgi:hypothetical protein
MDGPWAQYALFDFALLLPASMVAWTWLSLSCGWLRHPTDQPAWFRFIAVRSRLPVSGFAPNWTGILCALLTWGFFNYPQILGLLSWPYGWTGRLTFLAYFVAQGIWVLDLRRAIVWGATIRSSRSELVLVEQSAEPIASPDLAW